jgi:glucan 1,3-beta-glucosidase
MDPIPHNPFQDDELNEDPAATPLPVPDPPFMRQRDSIGSESTSPTHSFLNPSNSQNPLAPVLVEDAPNLEPKSEGGSQEFQKIPANRTRRLLFALTALLVVVLGVVLGVYFGVVRKHHNNTSSTAQSSPGSPHSTGSPSSPSSGNSDVTYGGDGTVVTTDQGTTFTYSNKFGGYFVVDKKNPFNNNARAQSWSPPLNTSWTWGKDQVLGLVAVYQLFFKKK